MTLHFPNILPLADGEGLVKAIFFGLLMLAAVGGQIASAIKKARERRDAKAAATAQPPTARAQRRKQRRATPLPLALVPATMPAVPPRPKPVPRVIKRPVPSPRAVAARSIGSTPPSPALPARAATVATRIGQVLRSPAARDALVLREVLGPPVSLRDDSASWRP